MVNIAREKIAQADQGHNVQYASSVFVSSVSQNTIPAPSLFYSNRSANKTRLAASLYARVCDAVVRPGLALSPAPAVRPAHRADAALHQGTAPAEQHPSLHGERRRAADVDRSS